jgi:hypothetical protein
MAMATAAKTKMAGVISMQRFSSSDLSSSTSAPNLSIAVRPMPARRPSTTTSLSFTTGAEQVLDLTHRGAVEGALQARFVYLAAAHLA